MQILLIILGAFIGLIALLLVVAVFIKKDYHIQRQIRIDKPGDLIFDYIRHLKNQDYYSKWVMADPGAKKTFRGTDGQPGFVYGWNGNNKSGEGEQEIVKIEQGKLVQVEIRFVRPFSGTASATMQLEPLSGNETLVSWGMTGRNKYPFNLMNGLVNGMLGKDLETSLSTLKNILENKLVRQHELQQNG